MNDSNTITILMAQEIAEGLSAQCSSIEALLARIANDFQSLTITVNDFTKSNPSAFTLPSIIIPHCHRIVNTYFLRKCENFFATFVERSAKYLEAFFRKDLFKKATLYYSKLSIKSQVLKKFFYKKFQ